MEFVGTNLCVCPSDIMDPRFKHEDDKTSQNFICTNIHISNVIYSYKSQIFLIITLIFFYILLK